MKNPKIVQPYISDNIAIKICNLSCVFDYKTEQETKALDNINLEIEKGLIYCIIGNSGSGKTTLVNHLNGLLKSKNADIYFRDIHIDGKKKRIKDFKKLRKHISMVFQFPEYQLFKDTILKDVAFGPIALGMNKNDAYEKAIFYLNKMGLNNSYLERSPFGLSGGQKRRVAIAGILAIEPEILIFDEPTAGLDPQGEQEMIDIILDSKIQGKTTIVITHSMDQVLQIADKIIVMDEGKIRSIGSTYEIFSDEKLYIETSIDMPRIIRTIANLATKEKRFLEIYEHMPKTIDQLAASINQIIEG